MEAPVTSTKNIYRIKRAKLLGKLREKLTTSFLNFLYDEEGQGTVEYILILSVSAVGSAQLAKQIISILDLGILRLGGQLEQDLKTGRAPLSVWEN